MFIVFYNCALLYNVVMIIRVCHYVHYVAELFIFISRLIYLNFSSNLTSNFHLL